MFTGIVLLLLLLLLSVVFCFQSITQKSQRGGPGGWMYKKHKRAISLTKERVHI